MELKDLVGEHLLDAVDFSRDSIKAEYGDEYEDCDVMRFRLDGVVYSAVEDPEDGYRSCMRELHKSHGPMTNVFQPQRVLCRHRVKSNSSYSCDEDDILEVIDVMTGKTVLEAGTTSVDDYYPCYTAWFKPENMACNIGKEPANA